MAEDKTNDKGAGKLATLREELDQARERSDVDEQQRIQAEIDKMQAEQSGTARL